MDTFGLSEHQVWSRKRSSEKLISWVTTDKLDNSCPLSPFVKINFQAQQNTYNILLVLTLPGSY